MRMHVRNEIKPRLLLYLFSAIFCCISLSVILPTNQESILSFEQEESVLQVYLMDEEHLLVPVALAQEQDKDSERQIEVMMQYLCNRQELEGFRGFFKEDSILETVSVKNGTATLNFNEKFTAYDPKDELKLAESIVWGATQFSDVKNVVLQLQGKELSEMPQAKTPLKQPLDRSIGIKHFETSSSYLHDSASLTIYGIKKISGQTYLIPRSRRVSLETMASVQSQVEAVIADLSVSSTLNSTMKDHEVGIETNADGVVSVSLDESIFGSDRMIKKDDVNELVLSLCSLPSVTGVQLLCGEEEKACTANEVLTAENMIYNVIDLSS